MDFDIDGYRIIATGEIEEGDSLKLSLLLSRLGDDPYEVAEHTVSLRSPGVHLFEGMRLGAVIRKAGMSTLVERGEICASLGGMLSGAAADGVGRCRSGTGMNRVGAPATRL